MEAVAAKVATKHDLRLALKARRAANDEVKHLLEVLYPVGSLVRYQRHGAGPVKIGLVLTQPAGWSFDDRIRIENEATGKAYWVEAEYILSLA